MKRTASELWAIMDENGHVFYSRGGSSSKRHLMVYETKGKAEAALNNHWTRQIIPDPAKAIIKRIL